MRPARLLAVAALAIAATAFGAGAQEELFPRPAALEPAVKFWTRVYTEVDTRSGFIHDSLRLDLVFQTVRIPDDLGSRERRRRVERATELTRNILNKLGTGTRDGLNNDEQRILALFPEGTSNADFRAAAGRLRFQLGQSDRFRAGLVRSGAWKPYIYETLAKQGLPRELAALPHVESSFNPTAYSKVGAAGMWQFTRSTGVRYMRVDHIVDERRDPFFATDAAARLLGDNYSVIQTWPLALTAYNHGLSGMRRAVQQQKTADIATIVAKYQSRSFGFASRNFYTAFLAALEIDTNPERYFEDLKIDPPSDTATVVVPAFVTAEALADALNLRENALRELNPALADTVWAGDKFVPKGFELRVPRSTAAVAEELLAALEASERFAAQRADREHRVRRGDTLSTIAAEYGVGLAALMRVNSMTSRDVIRVGQLIRLPIDGVSAPSAAAATRPVEPPPDAAEVSEPFVASDVYVVRRGDSIERIASRLGLDPEALVASNGIRDRNLIQVGQRLVVPVSGAPTPVAGVIAATAATAPTAPEVVALAATLPAATPAEAPLAAAELTAALTPALLADGNPAPLAEEDENDDSTLVNALATEQDALAADPSDYTVAPGSEITVQALETLGHYADWLGIPTQRLRDLNGLAFREAVVIGQSIKLALDATDAATFEQRRLAYHQQLQSDFFAAYQIEEIEDHVIKAGESLWVLAERRYNVPVWLLRQYNPDLNLDRVQPGVVVKFPRLRAIAAENVALSAPQVLADNDG